ncbi:MAG: translation initiation factor IF-2 [Tannerella sp.]|jgi:translation initiation factor IF-2|nr:translation initiation factor IF-2 [Tannerella sp.]
MPEYIKLNKVIKDLKVGLSTVVEYLKKKGHDVENNPNARITDYQFDLLINEFGKGLALKEKKTFNPVAPVTPPKEKPKPQETESIKTEIPDDIKPRIVTKGKIDLEDRTYNKSKPSFAKPSFPKPEDKPSRELAAKKTDEPVPGEVVTVKETPVVETPVEKAAALEPESKPKPVLEPVPVPVQKDTPPVEAVPKTVAAETVPKVVAAETIPEEKQKDEVHAAPEQSQSPELKPEPDTTPEPEPELKPEPEPKQGLEPQPETEAQVAALEKTPETSVKKEEPEEEPFRLNKPHIEPRIKVTGKIDLSAINQATSPRKKTKEEKKREREERRSKFMEQRKAHPVQAGKVGEAAPAKPKPAEPANASANTAAAAGNKHKHKRKRIRKERVDINNTPGTNVRKDERTKPRAKRPVRVEVNEEDVQKQIKETLARLTNKNSKGKAAKYRREKRDAAAYREQEQLEEEKRESKVLKITEFVTANDLASMMNMPVTQVISMCMNIGMMVSINQRLDAETINIVADEFGFTTEYVSAEVVEAITEESDREEDLTPRPPIITVMGHVDHGKTSLLDNIRKSNVIAGEAGGITQHIGAYNVKLPNGRHITFLDTPGHEAFTAMRARGAKMTDIVIIIVAADDDVMPQTVEAINHASAAGVPVVFAINKIDKPHANPEKIKEQLANMNYLVEDWGGKYQSQEISAKQGIGVPDLLEKVLLEADMLELRANTERKATGSIVESTLDKGRGYVSTVLVSNGTLKQGDVVLAGTHFGRVKAMFNERNLRIEQAGPSEPAIILGLDGAPQAGDIFNVLDTEQEAREIASRREQLQRELGLRTQKRFGLEELGRRRALGDFHELNLIVKGDVDGSVEALSDSLIKLSTEEIQVNVIHKAVGQISESDISLAETADAVIIGFQVRPSAQARRLAENEGVEVRLYSIIYDAINDVRDAMEGMLSPEIREDICGEVEVLQVFRISKVGTIAGCIVKEGKIKRTHRVRIVRDGIVVHTGELGSLKRFKDEAKEAVSGQDCGIYVNNYNDIQVGDIIEPFDRVEIKKTLQADR